MVVAIFFPAMLKVSSGSGIICQTAESEQPTVLFRELCSPDSSVFARMLRAGAVLSLVWESKLFIWHGCCASEWLQLLSPLGGESRRWGDGTSAHSCLISSWVGAVITALEGNSETDCNSRGWAPHSLSVGRGSDVVLGSSAGSVAVLDVTTLAAHHAGQELVQSYC